MSLGIDNENSTSDHCIQIIVYLFIYVLTICVGQNNYSVNATERMH